MEITKNKRYYTPEQEEFHVGFKYEVYDDLDTGNHRWIECVYGDAGTGEEGILHPFPIRPDRIRVRRIDEESLMSIGFRRVTGWYSLKYSLDTLDEKVKKPKPSKHKVMIGAVDEDRCLYQVRLSKKVDEHTSVLNTRLVLNRVRLRNISELLQLISMLGFTPYNEKPLN